MKTLTPNEILALRQEFNALYTDFNLLRDGEWEPDEHSCEASITVLEHIFNTVKAAGLIPADAQLEDTRG